MRARGEPGKALDMFKVPAQEKGKLLGLLGQWKKISLKSRNAHEAMGAERVIPIHFVSEEASGSDGW